MEVTILNRKFPNGLAHVLGPVHQQRSTTTNASTNPKLTRSDSGISTGSNNDQGDHHFVFFAHPRSPHDLFSSSDEEEDDENTMGPNKSEVTLEILMSCLDPDAMSYFFKSTNPHRTAKETTRDFGLSGPGSVLGNKMLTDEVLFDPCGYSLNAINTLEEESYFADDSFGLEIPNYATIHITPEPHCSFVSFETNLRDREISPSEGPEARAKIVEKVVSLYKPGRFFCCCFFSWQTTLSLLENP